MSTPVQDFLNDLASFFAAYLDAAGGFHLVRERLQKVQAQASAATAKSVSDLDLQAFYYTDGHPDSPSTKTLLYGNQGTVKLRNQKDGENSVFVARMLIVASYQLWEQHYRALIAEARGQQKNELKSDLFGDLRRYRHSIVHHRAIAVDEVKANKVLNWFAPGQPIAPTELQMNGLLFLLRDDLQAMEITGLPV